MKDQETSYKNKTGGNQRNSSRQRLPQHSHNHNYQIPIQSLWKSGLWANYLELRYSTNSQCWEDNDSGSSENELHQKEHSMLPHNLGKKNEQNKVKMMA